MSRGRGFSSTRGGSSYRGSSRGGSSWGSHRGSPRGGSGMSSFHNSFNMQRSKYNGSGSNERYGSYRSHSEDYRKPYKSDPSGYSGRDHHRHRSSPDRKRMRTESISSRHETYGIGTTASAPSDSGYGRYSESSGGGGGGGGGYSDRRNFTSERKPSSSSSSMSRNRDEFRKPLAPPPHQPLQSSSSQSLSSPKNRRGGGGGGGIRGHLMNSRGSMKTHMRDRRHASSGAVSATLHITPNTNRRRLIDNSYTIRRRRVLMTRTARTSSDFQQRRLKLRMRSAIIRRTRKPRIDEKEENDVDDEDMHEATVSDSMKVDHRDEKEKVSDNDETDRRDKKSLSPHKRISPKKESDKEERSKSEESDDADDKATVATNKKKFIRLVCPHCQTKCPTFIKYSIHLQSGRHMAAMRKVALRHKSVLGQMRAAQRSAQRELEKNADNLAPRTNFCPLCKLNYKQAKSVHQMSDSHKNMKKFLMPLCKICKITFKSPMVYESHCCSIEHIKRKQLTTTVEKSDKEDGSGIDDDNLENFMTIDSIGDVDDEDSSDGKKKEGEEKPKEVINVGIENIRKIEVHYCDLCRMYLPRAKEGEVDRILSKHCKQRTHMQKYVLFKEDRELTKRAERLQRKETAEKERERDKSLQDKTETTGTETAKDEVTTSTTTAATTGTSTVTEKNIREQKDEEEEETKDDMHEEGQSVNNKFEFDDEEEEDAVANKERYDRFRSGEKLKEDLAKEVAAVAEEKPEKDAEKIDTEADAL